MMDKNAKIYVAGHNGMVGSAIIRALKREGYCNIITRSHKELDLCRQEAVEQFFAEEKQSMSFWRLPKWEESSLTRRRWQIFFTTI